MGDFDKINLDLKQRDLTAQKKKLHKNNLRDGVVGNAFSIFIEQAIAKTEQTTDGQNDHSDNNNNAALAQKTEPEQQNKQELREKNSTKTDNSSQSGDKNSEKTGRVTEDQPKVNLNNTDLENLREALAIAGKRLEQFLFINPDNRVEVKKVDSVARVSKAEAVSVDNLLEEMIQNIKKARAGSLNKLSVTLKPENFGEMEIFFTIFEEDRIKKVFISFAGNEDALNLIKSNQQQLTTQLSDSGHFLGGMDFVLYGGSDHQRERGEQPLSGDASEFVEGLLKSTNKQDIINKIDDYVADLIVNYVT